MIGRKGKRSKQWTQVWFEKAFKLHFPLQINLDNNSRSIISLNHQRSYLFAVISFHMQKIGGEHATVHALLVSCDSTFDGDTLRCWPENKVLQILRRIRSVRSHGRHRRIQILQKVNSPRSNQGYQGQCKVAWVKIELLRSTEGHKVQKDTAIANLT